MSELASIKAVITGRVQGVYFRDFTRQKARQLGLTGYVKNLSSGAVEVSADGERAALEQLLSHLKQGPPRASVQNVAVIWGEHSSKFGEFSIRY